MPIHKEVHWCLAVINVRDKKLQYLDSLGGTDTTVLGTLVHSLPLLSSLVIFATILYMIWLLWEAVCQAILSCFLFGEASFVFSYAYLACIGTSKFKLIKVLSVMCISLNPEL